MISQAVRELFPVQVWGMEWNSAVFVRGKVPWHRTETMVTSV